MVGMLSDIGNVRKINEDYLGYHDFLDKKLYIVADGVGGHNAGEVASKIAVNNTIEYLCSIKTINNLELSLKEAIESSNKKIYEISKTDMSLNGMSTTITACFVKENNMIVANVGDSRCYVVQNGSLKQVTKDHSLVQELVDNGSITEEEAITHPIKNVITRALGTAENVGIDIISLDITNVSKILLCSDGLTDSLRNKEIYEIISDNACESACEKLVERSKQKGGRDNISVIIFEGGCKDDWNFTQ